MKFCVAVEPPVPGETFSVELGFDMRELASYDEARAAYILEPGSYILRVGNSSVDTRAAAVIELAGETVVTKVKNCCGTPGFSDWRPQCPVGQSVPEDVPVLRLEAGAIVTRQVDYTVEYEIDEAVKQLTDEQLALSNVGAFDPKGGMASMIGNASTTVAGAAGETTSRLKEWGFAPMVMADGPAGVRISPMFYRDQKGAHSIGQSGLPESVLEFMPAPLRWVMRLLGGEKKMPKNAEIHYQYCTALPIGTALAQT